jgi:hypothetical protein
MKKKDEEIFIEFEKDEKDKKKIDYDDTDYGVHTTNYEKKLRDIIKKNSSDEFYYNTKFNK